MFFEVVDRHILNGAIHFSPLSPCLPCLATTKKSRQDTDLATDARMDISYHVRLNN
ncbi:MAG: hypothetical protein F6K24_07970 [Okeania sp. SIO2D1]|nr:hypothetical protein [Okeania sp. SIO2D1]